MKKTIIAAIMVLCLLAGTSALAQDAKSSQMPREQWTPEQMAQKKTDRMTESLKLSKKQSKQLYDYNLMQVKEMQSQKDQARTDRKVDVEKLKSILTPEQFEQWKQMQAERMGKRKNAAPMGHKGGKGKGGKPVGSESNVKR